MKGSSEILYVKQRVRIIKIPFPIKDFFLYSSQNIQYSYFLFNQHACKRFNFANQWFLQLTFWHIWFLPLASTNSLLNISYLLKKRYIIILELLNIQYLAVNEKTEYFTVKERKKIFAVSPTHPPFVDMSAEIFFY